MGQGGSVLGLEVRYLYLGKKVNPERRQGRGQRGHTYSPVFKLEAPGLGWRQNYLTIVARVLFQGPSSLRREEGYKVGGYGDSRTLWDVRQTDRPRGATVLLT